MRFGFFGNANNFPFMLARALKRLGHDVQFIVDSSLRLSRPEFRYHDIHYPYAEWIHDVSPVRVRDLMFPSRKRDRILDVLRGCDAVILNGLGPLLNTKLGKPSLLLLTGTDLEGYGNFASIDAHLSNGDSLREAFLRPLRRLMMRLLVERQRAGICSATAVSYFARGLVPVGDSLLDEIGVSDEKRVFILMCDLEDLNYVPPPHNAPPQIFCATRLTWKKPVARGRSELDYKGSDIMVKGLAAYIRKTGTALDIRLVRKGEHVRETEELVTELGLAPYVTWLDEMSQQDVIARYLETDIVFEQLDQSVVAMAGLDAMALGRPVIANSRPEIVDRYFNEPSPVCQARTPEEVCAQLERLISDPQERESIGRLSRAHVERVYSTERAARICIERLTTHRG